MFGFALRGNLSHDHLDSQEKYAWTVFFNKQKRDLHNNKGGPEWYFLQQVSRMNSIIIFTEWPMQNEKESGGVRVTFRCNWLSGAAMNV